MPLDVRPLVGLRYDPARYSDLTAVAAPPYDVIGASLRQQLLSRSAYNIVAADLPVGAGDRPDQTSSPVGSSASETAAGEDENAPYQRAAELLSAWRSAGVLRPDPAPAFFLYKQEFSHAGRRHRRTGLMCRLRLAEFSEGVIRPHEQTFSGPKRDRLLLTRATRMQLSPIFGLYPDPSDAVLGELRERKPKPGPVTGEQTATDIFGVYHHILPISDPGEIARIQASLSDKVVTIADGHHRYETALNYRRELREAGVISDCERPGWVDHPANYVYAVLVSMHDPDLLILPTHRLLRWPSVPAEAVTWSALASRLSAVGFLSPTDYTSATLAEFEQSLARPEHVHEFPNAIGVFHPASDRVWLWRPNRPDPLVELTPTRSSAWRSLDVALLSELILGRAMSDMGLHCSGGMSDHGPQSKPELRYPHRADEVLDIVRTTGSQLAFILRPTPLAALEAVTASGELMPQKSTYFHPKMLTGLLLNPVG